MSLLLAGPRIYCVDCILQYQCTSSFFKGTSARPRQSTPYAAGSKCTFPFFLRKVPLIVNKTEAPKLECTVVVPLPHPGVSRATHRAKKIYTVSIWTRHWLVLVRMCYQSKRVSYSGRCRFDYGRHGAARVVQMEQVLKLQRFTITKRADIQELYRLLKRMKDATLSVGAFRTFHALPAPTPTLRPFGQVIYAKTVPWEHSFFRLHACVKLAKETARIETRRGRKTRSNSERRSEKQKNHHDRRSQGFRGLSRVWATFRARSSTSRSFEAKMWCDPRTTSKKSGYRFKNEKQMAKRAKLGCE